MMGALSKTESAQEHCTTPRGHQHNLNRYEKKQKVNTNRGIAYNVIGKWTLPRHNKDTIHICPKHQHHHNVTGERGATRHDKEDIDCTTRHQDRSYNKPAQTYHWKSVAIKGHIPCESLHRRPWVLHHRSMTKDSSWKYKDFFFGLFIDFCTLNIKYRSEKTNSPRLATKKNALAILMSVPGWYYGTLSILLLS